MVELRLWKSDIVDGSKRDGPIVELVFLMLSSLRLYYLLRPITERWMLMVIGAMRRDMERKWNKKNDEK